MTALDLAADFPVASEQDWVAAVAEVLRRSGVDGDVRTLFSETYDGLRIRPLYRRDDPPLIGLTGLSPFTRGARADLAPAGWDVRQRLAHPDPVSANRAILADLENGATSVWLVLGDGGLPVADLPRALQGVHLDLAPIALDAGPETAAAAHSLRRLAASLGVAPVGTLGADPIGLAARTGAEPDLSGLASLVASNADCPGLLTVTVDSTIYHDAGGSDADELAVAISAGLAYIRALTDAGIAVENALAQLEFRLAVTADQFGSIAKLRAARRMWDRVGELCGAAKPARAQRQHAVTSAAMMTRRDPWVNMLRTTIACFAAAAGGAEVITVAPFDSAIGRPDAFGRRIARNTSSILHDESSLSRVIDPAGGSWYVESRTDELAQAAWDRFTTLERSGGAADLDAVRSLLAPAADAREANIVRRRDPITGVSEFAQLDEAPLPREPMPARQSGGLPRRRYAEPFETLRDRADLVTPRPAVFLAALGPVAAQGRWIGFATNLFAAGGIETVVGTGGTVELVEAFAASGTPVACLCSSDAVYADLAAPLVAALKGAGARRIWIVGHVDVAGVDGRVYAGCDVVDVLSTTLHDLEVLG